MQSVSNQIFPNGRKPIQLINFLRILLDKKKLEIVSIRKVNISCNNYFLELHMFLLLEEEKYVLIAHFNVQELFNIKKYYKII